MQRHKQQRKQRHRLLKQQRLLLQSPVMEGEVAIHNVAGKALVATVAQPHLAQPLDNSAWVLALLDLIAVGEAPITKAVPYL